MYPTSNTKSTNSITGCEINSIKIPYTDLRDDVYTVTIILTMASHDCFKNVLYLMALVVVATSFLTLSALSTCINI